MKTKRAMGKAGPASVMQAFRELVYMGKDDVPQLAEFLGYRVGTLYNKADGGDEAHHKPTVLDLIRVTTYRQDLRAIHALAAMFDLACFDVAQFDCTSDEDLLALLTRLGAENGEFHNALHKGLAARRFSREAARQIRAEAFDVVTALMTLLRRLEDLVDDDEQDPAA